MEPARQSEDARSRPRRIVDSRPAVLITGASKGIGEACTLRLARDGFRVYAGVRRAEDGTALIAHGGDAVVPVILDVTNARHIGDVAGRIDQECGERGLQALVNNAGIAVAGPLEFLPLDMLRQQIDINFIAQIAVTQACLPLLRRSRATAHADFRCGRIVFISSVSGRSALPFTGAYAASKFALEAAADALRVELLPFGLGVSLVEPGVIATPIWHTSLMRGEELMREVPEQVEEFYGGPLAVIRRRAQRGMDGLPAERVADVVSHALTARRPKVRYVVGRDARMRLLLQALLPDRWRDRVIAQVLKKL